MSADRWGTCPKCKREAEKKEEARLNRMTEAYGVLPRDEYLKLVAEKPIRLSGDARYQLREDYMICMGEDGVFHVKFSCHCRVCSFSFTFKHEERLSI